MQAFAGFDETTQTVPVPEQFFQEVMLLITDRAELLVTLYAFWLAHAGGEERPFFRREDLEQDARFFQALADVERTSDEALEDALAQAVARGTLLHVRAQATATTPPEDWYCLNTPANRARVQALAEGHQSHVGSWAVVQDGNAPRLQPVRPNIFTLYEQNIGLLQPLIVEELREAEREYPPEWIEDAFRIAAQRNVRNWKYVRAILERWAREGRDHEKDRRRGSTDPNRYLSDPYYRILRKRGTSHNT